MCWMKLSCLLLVEVQKSSRTMICDSRLASPSSLTKVTLDFLPKGGFVNTTSKRSPDRRPGCRRTRIGLVPPLAADAVEVEVHHAQPGRAVDDLRPWSARCRR